MKNFYKLFNSGTSEGVRKAWQKRKYYDEKGNDVDIDQAAKDYHSGKIRRLDLHHDKPGWGSRADVSLFREGVAGDAGNHALYVPDPAIRKYNHVFNLSGKASPKDIVRAIQKTSDHTDKERKRYIEGMMTHIKSIDPHGTAGPHSAAYS